VRPFAFSTLLAAALFSVVVTLPFLPFAGDNYSPTTLTLDLTQSTSRAGNAQLFFDVGRGFNPADTTSTPVEGTGRPERVRLTFPMKGCRALRYDPIDVYSDVTITQAEIRFADGALAVRLKPADFVAGGNIASLSISDGTLEVRVVKDNGDPSLLLAAKWPTSRPFQYLRFAFWWRSALVLIGTLGLVWLSNRAANRRRIAAVREWAAVRPARAVAVAAVIAVTASTYPVVFLGQSYVSPNLGIALLYETNPTLPGVSDTRIESVMSSDIGAMFWSFLPATAVQHEALVGHGELPLWNRYNSCGVTLLGQGQSMFGDPLHFLPLLGNSAAWTWDAKFVLAKCLFVVGLGLCVLAVTRHLPSALLVTVAAPFLGFFIYRVNHSAFFSVCYAPWALYCWLRFNEAPRGRAALGWLGGLIVANWSLLTSGTVKEAYMLLLSLNVTGALVVLMSSTTWANKLRKLAAATGAGVVFILISSPIWLTFLDALLKAHTAYDRPDAYQLQPGMLLAFFDEIFYRPISDRLLVFRPGMNFVFLGGLACFFVTLREHFRNRPLVAIALGTLLPVAIAFGIIPPGWIAAVPFFGNVIHVDNTFLCVLIVLVGVLAGAGFCAVGRRLGTPEGRGDLLIAALLVLAPVGMYLGFLQAVHRNSYGPGLMVMPANPEWGRPVPTFVWGYLWSLLAALVVGAFTLRRAKLRGRLTPASKLVLLTCLAVLLWRMGMHVPTRFDDYVVNPTVRADLHAHSATVEFVQNSQSVSPTRVAGLGNNLFAGWHDMDRIEGVSGPDPIVNRHYYDLLGAFRLLPDGEWHPYFTPENLPSYFRYLDALNVRYYLQLRGQPGPPSLPRVNVADMDVYESPSVWPRAFFTDRVVVYDQPEDFARLIREGDGRPFAALQGAVPEPLTRFTAGPRGTFTPATNYRLAPNETAFDVQADGPGLVVLSEVYYAKDFHALVDGKPVAYYRVNHAFKGLYIDRPGLHRVSFRYWPEHLTLSLWLAAAGGLLAALAAAFTPTRAKA
jgi:hypothetical protein